MSTIRSLPSVPSSDQRLMVSLKGNVSPNPTCFAVNVQSGCSEYDRGNIYLHVSPVFSPPSRVVRNSLLNGSWGVEESTGWFPFQPNAPFEMTILVPRSVHSMSEPFKIAINGTHYADFYPRHSSDSFSTPSLWLSADGDAQFSSIETHFVAPPPSSAPMAPTPGYATSSAPPPYPINSGMPTPGMPTPGMPTPGMPTPSVYGRSPSPNPYPTLPQPVQSQPLYSGSQPYPTQQDQGYYPTPPGGYYGPTPPGGHYPGSQPHSSNSMMSKIQSALPAALGGGAAAAALGSVLGHKKHKKLKKNKFLGPGGHGAGHGPSLGGIGPGGLVAGAAGAALGAYALHKANPLRKLKKMKKGFKVGGGWSSSSSSSDSD